MYIYVLEIGRRNKNVRVVKDIKENVLCILELIWYDADRQS